jgi:hypothetical protein
MAGPWEQFGAVAEPAPSAAPTAGPWEQFGGAPETTASPPVKPTPLPQKDFEAEVLRRMRAGETPEAIRAFSQTVFNPVDPSGSVTYELGPELENVASQIQGGYSGPVQVLDTTESDKLGAFLRSTLDAGTLNFGDEATAGIKSIFGQGSYEDLVRQERAQRAVDSVVNPNEQMAGTAVGTIGTAMLPATRLLDAPTFIGKAGRGVLAGAGISGLSGYGASQSGEEALGRLPSDLVSGAVVGLTAPVVAAAPGAVASLASDSRKAIESIRELGISPAVLKAEYAAMEADLGRKPSIAEVLGRAGERLRPALAPVPELRDAAVKLTEGNQQRLSAGIRARTEPRSKAAQDMFDNAERRGDIEFARFRDVPVKLPSTDQVFLSQNVINEPGALGALKAADRDRIIAGVESGDIKAGDLDLLRRGLRKLSRTDLGVSYETLAGQVEDILTNAVPDATRAVRNYARRMSRAEGVEKVGEKALTASRSDFASARNRPEMQNPSGITASDQAVLDTLPAKDRGRLARQGGARIGANNAVAAEAGRNTQASYQMAANLEQDSNAAANLRLAMGAEQADELIRYVTAEKRAIDSLAALSGIPAQKVATLQDDLALGADIAAAASGRAGAGFMAGVYNHIVKTLGIGQGPARKLSEMLFEPGRADNVLRKLEADGSRWVLPKRFEDNAKAQQTKKMLEQYNITPNRLRQVMKDSLFLSAAQFGADNTRAPEGAVTVEPQ